MTLRTLAAVALAAAFAVPLSAQTALYEHPSGAFDAGAGQTVTAEAGWLYSENFLVAANDIQDTYLADDFVVPTDKAWTISQVSVVAFYTNGTGADVEKARDFNVIFWSHDPAGTPDAEVYRVNDLDPTSDGTPETARLGTGILTFDLPNAPTLTDGRYWVTVQANNPITDTQSDTRYLWLADGTAVGDPLQFYNYGGGLAAAAPCDTDWGDNTPECGNRSRNGNEPSVYVRLAGNETIVASEEAAQSRTVSLLPTRPNPAAASTLVPFTLREAADVRLAVYDALGRQVALVAERAYASGEHAERVDVSALAPGTYVVRLEAGADVVLRTIAVVR